MKDALQIGKLGAIIIVWLLLLVPLRDGVHWVAAFLVANVGIWAGITALIIGSAFLMTYLFAPIYLYLKVNYGDEREI